MKEKNLLSSDMELVEREGPTRTNKGANFLKHQETRAITEGGVSFKEEEIDHCLCLALPLKTSHLLLPQVV